MSLRISRLDGKVTLTLPLRAPLSAALSFAEERGGWIRAHLAEIAPGVPVRLGTTLPVEGGQATVVAAPRNALHLERGEIAVAARASVGAVVAALLKAHARNRLTAASDRYAAALGRPYSRLTLRDTRSRWGSCSSTGGLNYSWRLILAPPVVLDYVAAHEVAHLEEMNHSLRYWAVVRRLCPGFEAPRLWLRENGQDLHRYRFAAERNAGAD